MKANTAVLLTSFNRKENTLVCLENLFQNCNDILVYLVDDGSADGTFDAVSVKFPQVILFCGNGNLYWNRGMHLAWTIASKNNHQFYLWLNDDVILKKNALEELFYCSNLSSNSAIISGIIESTDGEIIYGGSKNKKLIQPNGKLNDIENLNGNVVLVPKSVFDTIGNLDPYFHHDLGDVEYGWRASINNIKVVTTRSVVGEGNVNRICRVRLNNSNIYDRFIKLYSPLGSPPAINFYLKRKKFGYLKALIYYFFLHFINVIPDWLNLKIFKNRYV